MSTDPRLIALRHMQAVAAALLVASVSGLLSSHWWGDSGGGGTWGWVRAFCEASTIGALADWFAVVALFRHPLGLKLPHTAIIAQNKDRIADNLANFVRDHFLDCDMLLAKLKVLNPAQRLSTWLQDPARVGFWVNEARGWALGALNMFDDGRMQHALMECVITQARQWDAATTTGEVLGLLTQDGRHHELLDTGLHRLGDWLAQDEIKAAVAQLVLKHVRKEWPTVVGVVDKIASTSKLADNLAEKLSMSALSELREVLTQPDHPVRLRYEEWLVGYIDRLRNDPSLRTAVFGIKERALTDPAVGNFVASLWTDIKQLLQDDLSNPGSAMARHLSAAMATVGERLASDSSLRDAVNEHVLSAAGQLAETLRTEVTLHIAQTVKTWDNHQLVQQLELVMGRDLQFIRINGTLVGGLAGLVIHAVVQWMGR